jgi:hypothetical protein
MYTIMNDIGFVTLAADRDQLTSAKTDTAKIST